MKKSYIICVIAALICSINLLRAQGNIEDVKSSKENGFRFKWRYQSAGSEWSPWEFTGNFEMKANTINLHSASHAGALKFRVITRNDGSFTAEIYWANSLHSLTSSPDYTSGYFTSQVELHVAYKNEVANPATFYLEVERVK